MTAEAKIRALAGQSAALRTFFGGPGNDFRWYDRQLLSGAIKSGTCARIRRISTIRLYTHETSGQTGSCAQQQPRFQIDVLDFSAATARAAAAAVSDWFLSVDFSTDDQFSSPPISPKRHPNFVLNQRADMEFTTQPPAYIETLDVRIFDLQE